MARRGLAQSEEPNGRNPEPSLVKMKKKIEDAPSEAGSPTSLELRRGKTENREIRRRRATMRPSAKAEVNRRKFAAAKSKVRQAHVSLLGDGGVRKWSLPIITGAPATGAPLQKRLALPQGELAQIWDGHSGVRYLAVMELRTGALRGNHYHLRKHEWVYLISGELTLTEMRYTHSCLRKW